MAELQTGTTPAASTAAPGRRRAWIIVGLVAMFALIYYMDKLVVGLVGVEIMRDLRLDAGQFGILQSSVYWLYAVGAIIGGVLVGRVPARWLLSGTALVWALSLVPMIWSESYIVLLLSRVMLGLAEGPAIAMAMATVHSWFPPARRPLPSSIVLAGAGIGPVIAAPLVTAVMLSFSWHAAFALLAAVGFVWVLAWLILGRDGPETAGEVHVTVVPLPSRVPYRRLLATGTMLGTLVLFFVAYCAVAIKIGWLPVYLRQALDYDAESSAQLLMIVYMFTTVFILAAGSVSQLLTRRGVSNRIARGAFAPVLLGLGGAATVGFALLDRGALQTVLLVVATGLSSTGLGVAFTVVSDMVPPRQRGVMISVVVVVYSLGGILGPILLGRVVEASSVPAEGYAAGFTLLGIVMAVGALIGMLVIHPDRDARMLLAADDADGGLVGGADGQGATRSSS